MTHRPMLVALGTRSRILGPVELPITLTPDNQVNRLVEPSVRHRGTDVTKSSAPADRLLLVAATVVQDVRRQVTGTFGENMTVTKHGFQPCLWSRLRSVVVGGRAGGA